MNPCVTTEPLDGITVITLNRPEVRNAFNDEVIAELTQAFTQLGQDPQVRARAGR